MDFNSTVRLPAPLTNISDGYGHAKVSEITSTLQMQIAYTVIGSIGIIDNFIVILVFTSSKILRQKITIMFIINQSIIDLATAIFLICNNLTIRDNKVNSDIYGEMLCKIWYPRLPIWWLLNSSTLNLLALTLERYFGIVHPMWHKKLFTKAKVKILLVLVPLIGFVFEGSTIMSSSVVLPGGQCAIHYSYPSPLVQNIVGIVIISVQYIIPFLAILYCYCRIALVIRSQVSKSSETTTTSNKARDKILERAGRNTVFTLFLVGMCFIACWSWNQVYFLMHTLGFQLKFDTDFYHFTVAAVFVNCCMNPFIYALKYEDFQKQARIIFCQCNK